MNLVGPGLSDHVYCTRRVVPLIYGHVARFNREFLDSIGKRKRQVGVHQGVHIPAAVQRETDVVIARAVDRKLLGTAGTPTTGDITCIATEGGNASRQQRQIRGVAPIER